MLTNSPVINDANLVNSITSKGFTLANKGFRIDREIMISNYTQETIDSCWSAVSTNIIQNYQKGKGTYIKNFGLLHINQNKLIQKEQQINIFVIKNQKVQFLLFQKNIIEILQQGNIHDKMVLDILHKKKIKIFLL